MLKSNNVITHVIKNNRNLIQMKKLSSLFTLLYSMLMLHTYVIHSWCDFLPPILSTYNGNDKKFNNNINSPNVILFTIQQFILHTPLQL